MKEPKTPPPIPGTEPKDVPQYRNNPEVDAKIDSWIQDNPKTWQYIKGMPIERAHRALALKELQEEDRQLRFHQRVRKQIDDNPEMKHAFQVLVRDLPQDQQEQAMVQLMTQTRKIAGRSKGITQGQS